MYRRQRLQRREAPAARWPSAPACAVNLTNQGVQGSCGSHWPARWKRSLASARHTWGKPADRLRISFGSVAPEIPVGQLRFQDAGDGVIRDSSLGSFLQQKIVNRWAHCAFTGKFKAFRICTIETLSAVH